MIPLLSINLRIVTLQKPLEVAAFMEAVRAAEAASELKAKKVVHTPEIFSLDIKDRQTGWQYQILDREGKRVYFKNNIPIAQGRRLYLTSGADLLAYLQAGKNAKAWVDQMQKALRQ